MKEVLTIIRPNKVKETKKALLEAGIPGYTGRQVRGKGKEAVTVILPDNTIMKTNLMHKREILLIVEDCHVDKVVKVIMDVNSTNNQGDGKIFVSPVFRTYTISEGK
ncbi:nitrogen regulatory protein P-II [Clostridium butyricum]|uniref:Nitrogen regulatory protein P-II n=1 Tax=Clostridium butyricum TaxID=1492 RepID=A0A512TLV6_CLOBU|nr:P-II family nitrogen regulator [Clostridium butyricum]NAS16421.1 P-II family nitrogen regulator [Clostridium butyricum]NOW24419.1 nitrogen regulatory protein PII 2 [Clostridium butyricum]GEQ21247.1 nitrogen regulatory protein P-II [Clostridium butyricum]